MNAVAVAGTEVVATGVFSGGSGTTKGRSNFREDCVFLGVGKVRNSIKRVRPDAVTHPRSRNEETVGMGPETPLA
jgi:hypothetical protein